MDPGSLKNTRRRTRSGSRATVAETAAPPVKVPEVPDEVVEEEGDDDDEDFLVDTELDINYDEDDADTSASTFTTTEVTSHSVERVTTMVDPGSSSVTTTTQMERTTTFSSSLGPGVSKPPLPMLSPCPSVLAAGGCPSTSTMAIAAQSGGILDEEGRTSAEPKVFKKGDQVITSYVDEETGRIAVYDIGVRLEVRDFADDQLWYPARIAEVDTGENEILVHFENWSTRYDEWIKTDSNRLRPSPNTNLVRTQFEVGEKVEALWSIDGQRYPGVIQTILPNDYYQVLFDDGIKLKKKYNQIFKIKKVGRGRPFGSYSSLKSKGMRPPPTLVPAPGVLMPRPPNAGLSPARRSSRTLSRPASHNSPDRLKDIPSPANLTDQSATALLPISPPRTEQSEIRTQEGAESFVHVKHGRPPGRHPKSKEPIVHYSMFTPITTDLGKRRRTIQDYSTLVKSRRSKSSLDTGSLDTPSPNEDRKSEVPVFKRRRRTAAATKPSTDVGIVDITSANSKIESLEDSLVQDGSVQKMEVSGSKDTSPDVQPDEKKIEEKGDVVSSIPESQVGNSEGNEKIDNISIMDASNNQPEVEVTSEPGAPSRKRRRTVHNYSALLNPKFDEVAAQVASRGRLSRRSSRMRAESSSAELSINDSLTKPPKGKVDAPIPSEIIESGTTASATTSVDKCADNVQIQAANDDEEYGNGQDLLDKAEIEGSKFESDKQSQELRNLEDSETPKKKSVDIDGSVQKRPAVLHDALELSVKASPSRRGRKRKLVPSSSSIVEDSQKKVSSMDVSYPAVETKKSIIMGKKSLEFRRRPSLTEEPVRVQEEPNLVSPTRRTSERYRSQEGRRFSIGKWQQERRDRSRTESDGKGQPLPQRSLKSHDISKDAHRHRSEGDRALEESEGQESVKVKAEISKEDKKVSDESQRSKVVTEEGRKSGRRSLWRNKAEGEKIYRDKLPEQPGTSSSTIGIRDEKLEKTEKDSSEKKSRSESNYTHRSTKRWSSMSTSTKLGIALAKSCPPRPGLEGRPRLKNSDVSPLSPYVIVAPIESILKHEGGSFKETSFRMPGETRYKIPPKDIITTRRKSRSVIDVSTLNTDISPQRKTLQKGGESSKSLKIDKYSTPPHLESSVKVADISDPEDDLLDPDEYRPSMKISIPITHTPMPPPIPTPIRKIAPRPSRSLPGRGPKYPTPFLPPKRELPSFSNELEPSPTGPRKKRPGASRKWRNSRRGAALGGSKSYDKLVPPVREKLVRVRKPGEILKGLSAGRLAKLRRKLYENGIRKRVAGEPVFKDVCVDIIKCSCGLGGEHGLMVQCELCQCWQHGNCFGIEDVEKMPAYYVCGACRRPDLQKDSRRTDWIHEFNKTGTLPTLSFCESADPNTTKVINDGNELMDRLHLIRELIHSTQVKINICEAVPDHPKIYQWHKPHPTPNEEVQVRNFNKTYRPVLRRLLRTHVKDIVNYKNKLRERVEKRIELREEKRLGIEGKATVRLISTEEVADVDIETVHENENDVVSSVMSDILNKLDPETPGSRKGQEKNISGDETSEGQKLPNSMSDIVGGSGLISKDIVTKVTPEKSNDNLMDIDVDLSETDGKFTSMEQDLDAAFNLNPDRLLETIQNLTSKVSDDPETSDLLLNIFDDPDFGDPFFPLSSSQESTKKTLSQETRNAGPAPEVRITPELCRQNLKKSIQDEQKLVDEYLTEMEKKVTELEILHTKTRKNHSTDPNKIAKLQRTMQIILNNIQSMQGTSGEEIETPSNN